MCRADHAQAALFSCVSVEDRMPADHPLRTTQAPITPILTALSPQVEAQYSRMGRPWIPPGPLLRALVLQVRFTLRRDPAHAGPEEHTR